MAKHSSSLNPFRLLKESFSFWRKQPALTHVLLWFFIVPVIALDLLTAFWPETNDAAFKQIGSIGVGLATLLSALVILWGQACVVLVARRMVVNRAGRSRTSFSSVRRGAIPLILPLLLGGILRAVITLEWALAYVLPVAIIIVTVPACRMAIPGSIRDVGMFIQNGIPLEDSSFIAAFLQYCGPVVLFSPLLILPALYYLRTTFFPIALASEEEGIRAALRTSRVITRNYLLKTIFALAVFIVVLFFPSVLAQGWADSMADLPLYPYAQAFADAVSSAGGFVFLLSIGALYAALRKKQHDRPKEVKPGKVTL